MKKGLDNKIYIAVVAFFGGALLGTLASLLLAPVDGRQMRKQISKKGRQAYDSSKDMVADQAQRVGSGVKTAGQKIGSSLKIVKK